MSCKNCNTNCYSAGTDGEMCSAWTKKPDEFEILLRNAERFGVTYYPSADGKGHVLFEGHEMADEELIDCLFPNADDIICTKVSSASIGIR